MKFRDYDIRDLVDVRGDGEEMVPGTLLLSNAQEFLSEGER